MSKSVNSPTARLLQSSRLFSLPRALPPPQLERITSTGIYRASDSATLPYPTRQAVTTPRASQARGDWGLKRPLPARATRDTSTPHIRVYANDTPDCITEFTSAADHTQTRAKWQEMSVPILRSSTRDRAIGQNRPLSVYEDDLDITDPAYTPALPKQRVRGLRQASQTEKRRWKFSGPWLASMQAGEFSSYLAKTIEGRKEDWLAHLRSVMLESRIRQARLNAQNEGEPFDQAHEQRLREQLVPTDQELEIEQKNLRDEHLHDGLSSRLTARLSSFLDLALPSASQLESSARTTNFSLAVNASVESPNAAPPVTHPGAGLSYVRTAAVMENHPNHGPQGQRGPVLGRVVRFRNNASGSENTAKVGVGGIVADDASSQTFRGVDRRGERKTPAELTEQLDLELEGGAKLWVHPDYAVINETGNVRLLLSRGNEEAVAVKTGDTEPIHQQRAYALREGRAKPATVRIAAPSANYGVSLPGQN